jgi:predicted RNA polymerase sigma factor
VAHEPQCSARHENGGFRPLRYHLMQVVRADLLEKLGRAGEAREALQHAAKLAQNERERALLLARARGLAH